MKKQNVRGRINIKINRWKANRAEEHLHCSLCPGNHEIKTAFQLLKNPKCLTKIIETVFEFLP